MKTPQAIVPDAVVRVQLFAPERGGRHSSIPPSVYRCPVFFGDQRQEGNECAFLLDQAGVTLEPGGASQVVPVKFLVTELVAEKLYPGARFVLWEGRDIGEAEVLDGAV